MKSSKWGHWHPTHSYPIAFDTMSTVKRADNDSTVSHVTNRDSHISRSNTFHHITRKIQYILNHHILFVCLAPLMRAALDKTVYVFVCQNGLKMVCQNLTIWTSSWLKTGWIFFCETSKQLRATMIQRENEKFNMSNHLHLEQTMNFSCHFSLICPAVRWGGH